MTNENIDLTEILKNCPLDTKLYSPIFGDVFFRGIIGPDYFCPIVVQTKEEKNNLVGFTKEGKYNKYGEIMLFPSRDQRDWSKWKCTKSKKIKFDPNTLQPFDKVLVRDTTDDSWVCSFFSHIRNNAKSKYKYQTTTYVYICCIPFNNDTKHLVGTSDDAPEYYRYWED